jgi:ABC-type sugar transport system ATPase subunit
LLKLTNITKSFGPVRALEGVSFDLLAGGYSPDPQFAHGAPEPDRGGADCPQPAAPDDKGPGCAPRLAGTDSPHHQVHGEIHALVGENGAGKSTLIKVITGALKPDHGTIEIEGRRVEHLSPRLAHALGFAATYQQPALFPDLSVAENITVDLEKPSPARRIRWSRLFY